MCINDFEDVSKTSYVFNDESGWKRSDCKLTWIKKLKCKREIEAKEA